MARKILLADDSVTAQNMGRKILADAGYEIITVNNGSAALKKIAELKPDLIVLDVYMPGYSGLEVCQRVKEAAETARIPILLTVGKLEPFKPEEAKRVRADGYIVKPFEASELLSALTKLEDKIVPRAEASKPGRFARTIAVVEEGRYDEGRFDKTMTPKEDSGWKDRIGFPSGKKKKDTETEDVDDAAIYNQVNKDLRTVIERTPAPAAKIEESKVDLGALASQGLPKDVTAEEIAALAAAAAQIKGTIGTAAESSAANNPSEPATEAQVATSLQASSPEATTENKIEATASEPKPETPAEVKIEEKLEPVAGKPGEVTVEASNSPTPADVTAAIAALEPSTYLSANASSGNGFEHRRSEDEPVTMAIASGVAIAPAGPRWAAVATALLPEESALSLENEMQKAYTALAASEMAYAPSAVAVAEPPIATAPSPVEAPIVDAPVIDSLVYESSITSPSTVSSQAVQSESTVGSEPAEPIRFAATNFEIAATPAAEVHPIVPPAPESSPVQSAEPIADFVSAAPVAPEAKVDETPAAGISVTDIVSQEGSSASVEPVQPEHRYEEQKHEDAQPVEAGVVAAPVPDAISESISAPQLSPPPPVSEAPAEQALPSAPASPASSDPAEVSAVSELSAREEIVPQESASADPVPAEPVHKEPDIAATTAAAWATWRRIRESGDGKSASAAVSNPEKNQDEKNETPTPHDGAAMAVAAGAEKAPDGIAAADPEGAEIANIVDSVLADLRPKIVAEISKKMGKKK